MAKVYGAKAANFSYMAQFLPENSLPQGVGIPFHYYEKFLDTKVKGKALKEHIAETLSRHQSPFDIEKLASDLEELRAMMINTIIPDGIYQPIKEAMTSYFPDPEQGLDTIEGKNRPVCANKERSVLTATTLFDGALHVAFQGEINSFGRDSQIEERVSREPHHDFRPADKRRCIVNINFTTF